MIYYIHGLNSCADANLEKKAELENILHDEVVLLSYKGKDNYQFSFEALQKQIKEKRNMLIIGTSLGGFYANELARVYSSACVLINPVVNPQVQLEQFLGKNTIFYTKEEYILTPETINSYTAKKIADVPRLVVIGKADNVLDHKVTETYFKDKADFIYLENEAHSISSLCLIKNELIELNKVIHTIPSV